MAMHDKPDLSRSAPVWADGDSVHSCRRCARDDCRRAGSFFVACTLHTERSVKDGKPKRKRRPRRKS